MTEPGHWRQQQTPAQDVSWDCHTCGRHYELTILWYKLTEDVGLVCPDCKNEPVWIQPPHPDEVRKLNSITSEPTE